MKNQCLSIVASAVYYYHRIPRWFSHQISIISIIHGLNLNALLLQILPLVPDVIHVFAQVVVSPDESDEVKTNIGKAVSHLISVYGQQMQPILSALPPAHANALAAFASRRWSLRSSISSVPCSVGLFWLSNDCHFLKAIIRGFWLDGSNQMGCLHRTWVRVSRILVFLFGVISGAHWSCVRGWWCYPWPTAHLPSLPVFRFRFWLFVSLVS